VCARTSCISRASRVRSASITAFLLGLTTRLQLREQLGDVPALFLLPAQQGAQEEEERGAAGDHEDEHDLVRNVYGQHKVEDQDPNRRDEGGRAHIQPERRERHPQIEPDASAAGGVAVVDQRR
jgi:hypothetical protein